MRRRPRESSPGIAVSPFIQMIRKTCLNVEGTRHTWHWGVKPVPCTLTWAAAFPALQSSAMTSPLFPSQELTAFVLNLPRSSQSLLLCYQFFRQVPRNYIVASSSAQPPLKSNSVTVQGSMLAFLLPCKSTGCRHGACSLFTLFPPHRSTAWETAFKGPY